MLVQNLAPMCAFAEFRCAGLSLTWPLLPDVVERFAFEVERAKEETTVSVSFFEDGCMCEPTEEMRRGLRALAEDLCLHAKDVQYSPNDYSDTLEECEILQMTASQAFAEYFPSLDTPPLRIRLC